MTLGVNLQPAGQSLTPIPFTESILVFFSSPFPVNQSSLRRNSKTNCVSRRFTCRNNINYQSINACKRQNFRSARESRWQKQQQQTTANDNTKRNIKEVCWKEVCWNEAVKGRKRRRRQKFNKRHSKKRSSVTTLRERFSELFTRRRYTPSPPLEGH